MALSDSDAVGYGLLELAAEEMYGGPAGPLNPPESPRIAAAGWKIVRYLTAQDALFPPAPAPAMKTRMTIDSTNRVYYGYVAQKIDDPKRFVAAIRGTQAPIEWFIDADFLPIPHPRYPGATVERGFWGVYQTMSLADAATGATTFQLAAEGVEDLVGDGSIVVTGHSLGAALATYFSESLSLRLGAKVSACLFASPQTGNDAWIAIFDRNVAEYRLFNYILDLVTHVPTGDDYATLSKRTVIQPGGAQAGIRLDLGCNHHLLCYCALLDFAAEQKDGHDTSAPPCILGDATSIRASTVAWALIVTEFGIATEKTRLLLEGLHKANLV